MGFLILELNFLVMGIMFLRKYFRSCQRRWANCNVTAHIISHRMYFVRLIILLLRGVEWSRFFPITSNGWVEVWFVLIYVMKLQFFSLHIGDGIYCRNRNTDHLNSYIDLILVNFLFDEMLIRVQFSLRSGIHSI